MDSPQYTDSRQLPQYEVGDWVIYEAFDGTDRVVLVREKHADIKRGRPGFEGQLQNDTCLSAWGYDSQITNVIRRGT